MAKNIVLCCDGTDDKFGAVNTNVVRMFQCVERNGPEQVAFYDPGVGTFAAPVFGFHVGTGLGKLLGKAFGYGIKTNMEACYRFLMNTWEPGDKVFIFGFSRGAFTARSLASMLDTCGVLYRHHENLVSTVFDQYFGKHPADEVAHFKATFARPCTPWFVGVWDTVGALGALKALRKFKNNKLSPNVKYAFQALSIDEKRSKFIPSLWDMAALAPGQTVEQIWFAGVHGDVGGGYADHALADVPMRWMAEHAHRQGLVFARGALDAIKGDPLGRMHDSYKGWWRLLGKRVRHIPDDAQISAAVTTRLRDDPTYRPVNFPSGQH